MQVKGIRDSIAQPLYDTVPLPAAGATKLTFFALPLGQGTTAFGTGAKHLGDTNMDLAGQLASGFAFQLNGFRLMFPWNIPAADVLLAINGAAFRFFVGAKEFLRVPARTIPSGNGPFQTSNAGSTAATNVNSATSGWPSMQNAFAIGRKPLYMIATENFSVTIEWQGGVQAISAQTFLTVVLDGYLGRPVQ
jgi:hypothetical protein